MSKNWNPENWVNIPAEMRERAQWMVCEDNKVPCSVHTGFPADNTNPANWASFREAEIFACNRGMWIGFCFAAGGGITCIDVDNKADPNANPAEYEENQERMRSMYRFYDSYIEQSKSGNGLHIILQGEIGEGRRRGNVEVYSQERFMIMTGDIQKDRPLYQGQGLIDNLRAQMEVTTLERVQLEEVPPVESDAEVARRILNSKSGGKFEKLIAPDWDKQINPNDGKPYGEDPSRADYSFATLVGFFTKSNAQIWSMFKQTALGQRMKNGRERHPDYGRFLAHSIQGAREWLATDAAREELSDNMRNATESFLQQALAAQSANAAVVAAKESDPAQAAVLNWKPDSDHLIVNKHQFVFKKPFEITSEPPLEWALENVFQKQSVNSIYGWSGVGKSFIALDLMMAVSEGRDWFGHETEQMHVTYLALEGGEGMRNRLEAYRIGRGATYQLPMNFDIYRGHFNICDPEHVSAMIYQRQQAGIYGGMFVIDTFAKAIIGADENSAKEMGPAVQQAQLISDQLKACVVLVHHSTKPDPKTGLPGGLRGSGAIQAGIDGVIQVARVPLFDEDDPTKIIGHQRVLIMDKVKEGADRAESEFHLEVVQIGERVRKSGEVVPVTSCCVKPVSAQGYVANRNQPTYNYGGGQVAEGAIGALPPGVQVKPAQGSSNYENRGRKRKSDPASGESWEGMKPQDAIRQAIIDGSQAAHSSGKYGSPTSYCAPRTEALERAIILRNYPTPGVGKRDLERAIDAMIKGGKLGSQMESGKIQWLWINGE